MAARAGKPIEDPIFAVKQDKLRWSHFKEPAPEQMFETVRDGVFSFIKTLGHGRSGGECGRTGNVVGRGHRGAMSNRRGGRFSAPDPRVGCR